MSANATIEIYISLLDEGVTVSRPTQAIALANGLYKVLATTNYNPETETWEFAPGSIVRCEPQITDKGKYILLAVEKVG